MVYVENGHLGHLLFSCFHFLEITIIRSWSLIEGKRNHDCPVFWTVIIYPFLSLLLEKCTENYVVIFILFFNFVLCYQ